MYLRPTLIAEEQKVDALQRVIHVLDYFPSALTYIQEKRRSKKPQFQVQDEYDVQDLLLFAFRCQFVRVVSEDPSGKVAGKSARPDIVLRDHEIIIEVKYCRSGQQEKVVQALMEDLVGFQRHPNYRHIVNFVYNENRAIKDPASIERDLSQTFSVGGKECDVVTIIRP